MTVDKFLSQSAVLDFTPAQSEFREQFIAGLTSIPRTLPSKFFYDDAGSALFASICELPEYYITRTEIQILRKHGAEIGRAFGANAQLVGLGTGAGTKTRLLLEHLENPAAYVPVDISKEQLTQSASEFRKLFPALEVLPVSADYLRPFALPYPRRVPDRNAVYFPGSTIGNLEPDSAREFLEKINDMAAPGGRALIGVDLKKSRGVLERAYNDAAGVTAQFNLNLLARANRELEADFNLACWNHFAFFNEDAGRIEMHLVSMKNQTVRISGDVFHFDAGEHVITEYSYKYSPEEIISMADAAELAFEKLWTDREWLFGLFLFAVKK